MLSNECKCTVVVPVTEPRVGVVPIVSMSRRSVHVVLGERQSGLLRSFAEGWLDEPGGVSPGDMSFVFTGICWVL